MADFFLKKAQKNGPPCRRNHDRGRVSHLDQILAERRISQPAPFALFAFAGEKKAFARIHCKDTQFFGLCFEFHFFHCCTNYFS
jgi:hypothetical protein